MASALARALRARSCKAATSRIDFPVVLRAAASADRASAAASSAAFCAACAAASFRSAARLSCSQSSLVWVQVLLAAGGGGGIAAIPPVQGWSVVHNCGGCSPHSSSLHSVHPRVQG